MWVCLIMSMNYRILSYHRNIIVLPFRCRRYIRKILRENRLQVFGTGSNSKQLAELQSLDRILKF